MFWLTIFCYNYLSIDPDTALPTPFSLKCGIVCRFLSVFASTISTFLYQLSSGDLVGRYILTVSILFRWYLARISFTLSDLCIDTWYIIQYQLYLFHTAIIFLVNLFYKIQKLFFCILFVGWACVYILLLYDHKHQIWVECLLSFVEPWITWIEWWMVMTKMYRHMILSINLYLDLD